MHPTHAAGSLNTFSPSFSSESPFRQLTLLFCRWSTATSPSSCWRSPATRRASWATSSWTPTSGWKSTWRRSWSSSRRTARDSKTEPSLKSMTVRNKSLLLIHRLWSHSCPVWGLYYYNFADFFFYRKLENLRSAVWNIFFCKIRRKLPCSNKNFFLF